MLILVHLAAAIGLFFFTNWIGKNSSHFGYTSLSFIQPFNDSPAFNLAYRVFAPVAFITLLAALLYWLRMDKFVKDIYRISVLYFVVRYLFFVATERLPLVSHWQFFFIAMLSIFCSIVAYEKIISKREFFFPEITELGSALWLGVAAFLYKTLNSITTSDSAQRGRVKRYVQRQYKNLRYKYWKVVDESTDDFDKRIVYAVMIYEALNRPRIFSLAESVKLRITGSATIGPMQVYTERPIGRNDAIRKGIQKLRTSLEKHTLELESNMDLAIREMLNDYNPGHTYTSEILEILEILETIDSEYPSSTSATSYPH